MTGAGGLVGGRIAQCLDETGAFDIVAARYRSETPRGIAALPLDLMSAASIEAAVDGAKPDAVVHSAAAANADRCEADPATAEALNVRAAEVLARTSVRRSIALVALSTDLVLPGDRALSTEAVRVDPALVYGRTKRAGEDAILSAHPRAVVFRTALVTGRGHGGRGTASESIAWALARGERLRLFVDQYRTPIDCDSVANAVARALRLGAKGLVHLGGPERLSRFELGLRVARALDLPVEGLEPIREADLGRTPRPADVSLDSSHAARLLSWTARPLDDSIRAGRMAPARL